LFLQSNYGFLLTNIFIYFMIFELPKDKIFHLFDSLLYLQSLE
jgi:hypothetical protein